MPTEIGGIYVSLGMNTRDFDSKIPDVTKKVDRFAGTVDKRLNSAISNLSFQVNDIATQLASGSSPFQVLAQQGGQVVQAFQQGGGVSRVLGGTATAIRGLITPTTAVVASTAALAAGIGVLVDRAASAEASARKFDVVLKGLGSGSLTTGKNLETMVRQLRDVGLSASEARDKILQVTRSGLNPARAGRIVTTGQNIGAILGGDGTSTLTSALAGGLESTIALGFRLRAFTADEVEAWREMARLGEGADALSQAFDKLSEKVKDADKNALTPFQQSIRDIKNEWSSALDALSDTSAIKFLADRLADAGRALGLLAKGDLSNLPIAKRYTGVVASAPIPPAITGQTGITEERALELIEQYESDGRNIMQGVVPPGGGYNPSVGRVTGPSTAQGYYQITNETWRDFAPRAGIDLSQYPNAMSAPRDTQKAVAREIYRRHGFSRWAPYNAGLRNAINREMADSGGGSLTVAENTEEQESELRKIIDARQQQIDAMKGVGAASDVVRAKQEAETIAATKKLNVDQKARLESELINDVYRQREIAQNKVIQQTEAEISATRDITKAYSESSLAGIKAEGQARAANEAFMQLGTTGGKLYDKFVSSRSGQLLLLGQERTKLGFAGASLRDRDTAESLRLETSLVGRTTDEIDRQVALLKVKQQAQAVGLDLTDEEVQARLREVNALYDAVDALQAANDNMDSLKELTDSVKDSFEDVFDTIVDGTFEFGDALGTIAEGLGKKLVGQGLDFLFDGAGGIFGGLGKLLGFGGGSTGGGGSGSAYADGGSFTVGGSGAIDSKIVAFRATPGEKVKVQKNTFGGNTGAAEVIRLELNPSEAFVSNIADQRIKTKSGTIVQVAVKQSQNVTRRNFNSMANESQARRA